MAGSYDNINYDQRDFPYNATMANTSDTNNDFNYDQRDPVEEFMNLPNLVADEDTDAFSSTPSYTSDMMDTLQQYLPNDQQTTKIDQGPNTYYLPPLLGDYPEQPDHGMHSFHMKHTTTQYPNSMPTINPNSFPSYPTTHTSKPYAFDPPYRQAMAGVLQAGPPMTPNQPMPSYQPVSDMSPYANYTQHVGSAFMGGTQQAPGLRNNDMFLRGGADQFEIQNQSPTPLGAEGRAQDKPTPKKKGGREPGSVNKKKSQKTQEKKQTRTKSNTYKFDPEPRVLTYGEMTPYWKDHSLNSASACRDYLAHPHHVMKFEIPGDDWQNVRDHHLHKYVGKIYDNLLHPHASTGPVLKHLGDDAQSEKRKRYNDGQIKATKNIGVLLGAVDGEECAKRQCRLLIEAVLNLHALGPAYVTWEGFKWYDEKNRKVERIYRLELGLICSKRLQKIVDVVRDNKLIAEDVVQGVNFNKLANDPEFCHEHKVTLSNSNSTRQSKTDDLNAKVEEQEEKGRAAMEDAKGNADGLDDEDDVQCTRATRFRRKTQPRFTQKLKADHKAESSNDTPEGDSDGSYRQTAGNKRRRKH